MNFNRLSPRFIIEELDKVLSGQKEYKETLAIAGYNHVMRWYNAVESKHLIEPPRFTVLVTGPTGCGKTAGVEALGHILGLPFLHLDATHIAIPGFQGTSLAQSLSYFEAEIGRTPMKDVFSRSIIFIDEIDKLGCPNPSTRHADHNVAMQHTLLTTLDGTTCSSASSRDVDTKNMLFILAGAFEPCFSARDVGVTRIGFNAESHSNPESVYKTALTVKELEASGIIRELLGRISVITPVYKLSRSEIKDALENVQNSILEQFATLFYLHEQDLPFKDQDLDMIVDKLYNSPYGMRHSKQVMFDYFREHMLLLTHNKEFNTEEPHNTKRLTYDQLFNMQQDGEGWGGPSEK